MRFLGQLSAASGAAPLTLRSIYREHRDVGRADAREVRARAIPINLGFGLARYSNPRDGSSLSVLSALAWGSTTRSRRNC